MSARLLSARPEIVAPRLLGSVLTSDVGGERVSVRLTEVEAYGGAGEDPGSHAFRGPTPRNATMFGPAGHAYIYFTYGMHWCANVVTGPSGSASAVLIRAGEVVEGVEIARRRRPTARTDRDLARGPARLTVALGITGELDGVDMLDDSSPLRLVIARRAQSALIVGPRTGVAGRGAATPWRFATDHPTVSPYRPASRRTS
ncbi:MAG: DNA-3-methyladenine glycosylase [Actinomycetota bacterium]